MDTGDRRDRVRQLVRVRHVSILVVLAVSVGCDSGSPAGPSPLATPVPTALGISSVLPITGSTDGGTSVTVSGTGFEAGAVVVLDGVRSPAYVENRTVLRFTTAAHEAGAVDIVVANPGDRTARLPAGFTFAPPQSFDFNGTWRGLALAHPEVAGRLGARHSDMELQLVIRDDLVTVVVCADYSALLVQPLRVTNGAFVGTASDGVVISGRIVSATSAVGTIDTLACPGTRWSAARQP